MPARKTYYKTAHKPGGRQPIPPGVQAALVTDAQAGTPPEVLAPRYGIDIALVRRLTANLEAIPQAELRALQAVLPAQYTVLAASFGHGALDALNAGDATSASKLMFSSKLAMEATKLAQPQAAQPGVQILAFIGNLTAPQAPQPVVITGERLEDDADDRPDAVPGAPRRADGVDSRDGAMALGGVPRDAGDVVPGCADPRVAREVILTHPVENGEIPAAPQDEGGQCQNGTDEGSDGLVVGPETPGDQFWTTGSVIADLQPHDRAEGTPSASGAAQVHAE